MKVTRGATKSFFTAQVNLAPPAGTAFGSAAVPGHEFAVQKNESHLAFYHTPPAHAHALASIGGIVTASGICGFGRSW